jgi:hypothetical protein
MGSFARALEIFFTGHGLAMATDQAPQPAAGRRQRRIDTLPEPLRPSVDTFAAFMTRSRDSARRAGTRRRNDATDEAALAIIRDCARFLASERRKQDWALTDIQDARSRKRRTSCLVSNRRPGTRWVIAENNTSRPSSPPETS